MSILTETKITTLSDYSHLRFLREIPAPFQHAATARCIPDVIVYAYSVADDGGKAVASRVWYTLATEDDGITDIVAPDPLGGLVVHPPSIERRQRSTLYADARDAELSLEAKRRAGHIAHHRLQARLDAGRATIRQAIVESTAPAKRPWWKLF